MSAVISGYQHIRHVVVLFLFGMLISGIPSMYGQEKNGEDESKTLREKRQDVKLKLLRQREKLLSEDEEIAEVHRKIMRLYRKLDRLLGENPEIKRLREKLDKLETRMEDKKKTTGRDSDD